MNHTPDCPCSNNVHLPPHLSQRPGQYEGQAVAMPGAPSLPAVAQEMDRLEREVSALGEVLGRLEDRLIPVLSEPCTNDAPPLGQPYAGSGSLARRLNETSDQVGYLQRRIALLIARAEV